jgi:RND family efflux transporter MFP subunit
MKKKKIIISIIAGILLLALIAYQSGAFRTGLVEPGNVEIDTVPIKGKIYKLNKTQEDIIYKAVGTIHSREEVELSPRMISRIVKVNVRSGDTVKKGEVLVELDDVDLKAAVARAKENVRAARSSVDSAVDYVKKVKSASNLAKIAFDRYTTLIDKKVIAQKTLDEAKSTYEQSMAAVSRAEHEKNRVDSVYVAAENGLKEAEARLSYAYIKSPMDGIVSERFSDPGDLASPGIIIMTVFDPTRLMMYVPIRESLVSKIKVGDSLLFHVEALNKKIKGTVKEIVASVDPGSRTFLVKACLSAPEKLMPGMFGTVDIKVGSEKLLLIPKDAVVYVGELEYVHVKKDSINEMVFVRTSDYNNYNSKMLKVISGLHEGEEIIIPDSPELK